MNNQKTILFSIILYISCLKIFNIFYSIVEFTGLINNFSSFGYYAGIISAAILSILLLKYLFKKGVRFIDRPFFIYASAFIMLVLAIADQFIAYRFGLSIGGKEIDLDVLSLPQNIRGQIYIGLHILILLIYKWIFEEKAID